MTDPSSPDASAVRAQLREFSSHYDYDTTYLEELLELSPAAHATFAAAMGMAHHRVHLPIDVHFVARISMMQADDCGACTQLSLRMAVEAGVARSLLQTLLTTPADLPPVLRLVREHAQRIAHGENGDADTATALRDALGGPAFAELCVNIVGCRIYPALKRALGAERACRVPSLDFR